MKGKTIALVLVIIIALVGIYYGTRPILKKEAELTTKAPVQPDHDGEEHAAAPTRPAADEAYQDYLNWKNGSSPTLQAQDERLEVWGNDFPKDYRFTLERIRGSAKVKGVHSHTKEFQLLAIAAQTAIECNCGDAEKMHDDLLSSKSNKLNGFWKLSTHPKQWNMVVEALEKKNISLLEEFIADDVKEASKSHAH